jgi:hypothetical protein
MLNKRKAAIGYATYVVGTRVAKRVMRRKARGIVRRPSRDLGRPRRRAVLPLAGGAAAAIAGTAVLARRRRAAASD